MAMIGMDVGQVTTAKTQITNLSGQLQTLIGQLDSQVQNLSSIWQGADYTAFSSEWTSTHHKNLVACKTSLDNIVTQLQKEITQQNDASAT